MSAPDSPPSASEGRTPWTAVDPPGVGPLCARCGDFREVVIDDARAACPECAGGGSSPEGRDTAGPSRSGMAAA
jgi:hypothetical protein